MSLPEIAVLSYHGWEIDPARLADDVRGLRSRGWADLSLQDLKTALARNSGSSRRHFHVTIDDGAQGDRDCVATLRGVSCPVTLFLPLEAMSADAQAIHRDLASCPDVALEDHSLRHNRAFHYRHVIGFHCEEGPLLTSPERLGLRTGDPVCTYGSELARRRFTPDLSAGEVCRVAARSLAERPGGAAWTEALTARLLESRLGYRRLGRLCVAGSYESQQAFSYRLSAYLAEGRDLVARFTGRPPIAFAHPWWEHSRVADACLRELGYALTFSGRGMCRRRTAFQIPRLLVSNDTPRPIDPHVLAGNGSGSAVATWVRDVGRRAVFA